MKTILIHPDVKGADQFFKILSTELEGFKIVSSLDNIDAENVEVAIIWLNVPKYLSQLKNLKLLMICGSGIDHIINSPDLPRKVPTVRLVDPYLRYRVTNYIIDQIFRQFLPDLNPQDQEIVLTKKLAIFKKPKIGIMGLGMIGAFMAKKLIEMGFHVCGWVRSTRPRTIDEIYVGDEQLKEFAKNCEVLVCQLPLTMATYKILNKNLFDLLPNGAYLINVGRGSHLEEDDLLSALDSGKLAGACLDVFEVEPLPQSHLFHSHEKITVTPHIAGYIGADTQAPYAAQVITSFYQNEKILGMVDYKTQY
jgi:glyoxylate/hydroxypyruvate reductase A